MTSQSASCACRALRAVVVGEPLRVAICHCHACRTRTGSAFSWNARFAADAVTFTGPDRTFDRIGDEGSIITYHFCPTCGVTVWYSNSDVAGIAIPVGTFAPGALPPPGITVYDNRRPDWLMLADTHMTVWN